MHLKTNIDHYLSEVISPSTETKLRHHLRACERCRSYYDRQVVVLRALSGNPETPTAQEEERSLRLALRGAGLPLPERVPGEKPGLLDRIIWAPALALAVAVALIFLVVAVSVWNLLSTSAEGSVIAARLVNGRNLKLDGVPLDTKVSTKAFIHAGSKLEVARGGIAELSLERGGTVRVFPGSTLSLSGPGERLDLASGKVWCLVEPTGVPFVVRTDVAEARVVGTSFLVERRQSGETEVRVVKGVVEVRDTKKRGMVRVEGCRKTRVAPGRSPSPPDRYIPKHDRSDWEIFMDELSLGIQRAAKQVEEFFRGE